MAQSKFRFSIRAILIATGYTAIAVAALVNPTKPWLGVMYGITVALLFFSLLGMIYRTERARAFWTGFALFGFGYLAIIFGPFAELAAKLPTSLVLDYALGKVHGIYAPTMLNGSSYGVPTTYIPAPVTTYTTPSYFPSSTTPVSAPSYESVELPATHSAPTNSITSPDPDELPETESAPSESSESTNDRATQWYEPSEVVEESEEAVSLPQFTTPMPSSSIKPYPPLFTAPFYSYSTDGLYNFRDIGNAGFAMLFAAVGGLVAQFLFALRAGEPSPCAKE